MTPRDKQQLHEEEVLRLLASAVRVMGSVVGNNVEVVLHDLRRPEYSILEIAMLT
jgi:predicted transcriptional regulator YheO